MTEIKNPLKVRVECYSGYRADESPRRFTLGKNKIEVLEIMDRWLAPDHRYFKIKGSDDCVYILRHDEHTDQWELTMYDTNT
jgi:hypothetical protein